MRRFLQPQWCLILFFLGLMAAVPLLQAVKEAGQGEWPQALVTFPRQITAANLRAYDHGLDDASWVAARFRPWAQYAELVWLGDGGEKAVVGRDGWLFYRPGVQYVTERPRPAAGSSSAAEAVATIVAFRDELAARNIHLLLVPAPNKESVYPEKLTRRAATLSCAPRAETRLVFEQLNAAGVEVVDLFAAFAATKSAPATPPAAALYLAQDSHWSPAGLEVAARTVARRILDRGWGQLGAVSYETKLAPVDRLGDVARMLQVPRLERELPPEKIPAVQVLRRDTGQLYQDEPGAEILVLGDSFLRIYQQDAPSGAGFIAHLARELRQPLASVVNDGGASTLVRQELHRRPALLANKKLVIWEFVERDIRLGTEGWQKVPLPP
jgi:hypothetical protein